MPRRITQTPAFEVYTCARHGRERKDTTLQTYLLCSDCAREFQENAFNGLHPLGVGQEIDGFCSYCNRQRRVGHRQWFVCLVCDRVVRSIGRSHVASSAVIGWWESIQALFPQWSLVETDRPQQQPRGVGQAMTGFPPPDFTCLARGSNEVVFTIELKVGRSAISGMSEFQLDISDCDGILAVVRETRRPGFVIHAQVVEQFTPPSSVYKTVGLWWTDVFQMWDHFRQVRRRQTEQRSAAYFARRAFQDIASLASALEQGLTDQLARRIEVEGVPELYLL